MREPKFALPSHELRTMEASRGGPCHYCKDPIEPGSEIAGHYGILWGHQVCVRVAVDKGDLILSPNNKSQRPSNLEARCGRRWRGNKVIALTHAERHARGSGMLEQITEEERLLKRMRADGITIDTRSLERRVFEGGAHEWPHLAKADSGAMEELAKRANDDELVSQHHPEGIRPKKKPVRKKKVAKKKALPSSETQLERPTSCKHFDPQLIEIVTMPTSMRPTDPVIEEFEACPETLQEIVDRQWQKYLEERFAAYKKGKQHLPICHHHSSILRDGKHQKPVHLSVIHMDLEVQGFKWKRALWWACPGTDKEEDDGSVK